MIELRPFQRRFLRGAFSPGTDTAALSLPRGNGKSTLAAWVLARCLTPGDEWHKSGWEYALLASTLEQARHVFNPLRAELESRGGYRFIDSVTRCGITHVRSGTRLRVLSSSGKAAMGLVRCPLVWFDEPGALRSVNDGQILHDAIQTAQGKPGSRLRAIYAGTLAPTVEGWWPELVNGGSRGSVHVTAFQGDPKTWDSWPTICRCNPLMWRFADSRRKLLEERDAARADTRLKARFLSYRLNRPTADESTVLLTVEDWQRVVGRAVPDARGRPLVAVDLGGGRAWSAAVAIWKSGRMDAIAVAPGIPSVEAQERRDRVPGGTYSKLLGTGALRIADGLRVQPPEDLVSAMLARWGRPTGITCDRFRLNELADCARGIPLHPRVSRWSESSFDIRSLRRIARDAPLSCVPGARHLVAASLSSAKVRNDTSGNTRLEKRDRNNQARDDVAAALVLAAGAFARASVRRPRWRYRGAA